MNNFYSDQSQNSIVLMALKAYLSPFFIYFLRFYMCNINLARIYSLQNYGHSNIWYPVGAGCYLRLMTGV